MRKLINLKLTSFVLLLVMLTVSVKGMHDCAHAMQESVTTISSGQTLTADIPFSHHSPLLPGEQHQDADGCDSCFNCACHAPFTIQPFQLGYNPVISSLSRFEPFKSLPEVYLSKFIPPQIQA